MSRKHLGCDFTGTVTLAFEAERLEVVGEAKCDQLLVEPGFHKASAYRGGRLKTSSATIVSRCPRRVMRSILMIKSAFDVSQTGSGRAQRAPEQQQANEQD